MLDRLRAPRLTALFVLVLGCGKAGETSGPTTGKGPTGLPSVPGTPDTSVKTALPPVPRLAAVSAVAVGDSVSLSVEPVAGARDYRVYVLPSDGDISATGDGLVTVRNAVYRCAGDRQSPRVSGDATPVRQSEAITTIVEETVEGYKRTLPEATLGYVYVTPGDGRVPVYALGDPNPKADNSCFHQRWSASRVKRYLTSEQERTKLLALRWRDDGIAFYVPAAGSEGSKPVYTTGTDTVLYFVDGPEAGERAGASSAFSVLAQEGPVDAVPLMRVFYQNGCGNSHDELAAGLPRFERARFQGDALPMFDLHWSGITGDTTLVVEALDQGCPYPGMLASVSREAANEEGIDYPAFLTLEDARAASATGEVFINGQHDAKNKPRPIARSFVKVSPGPKPAMDWFAGFGPEESLPDFNTGAWDEPCESPANPQCLREYRQKSEFADITFGSTTPNRSSLGPVLGQLWVTYADVGADVGGKFRLTPNVRGQMSATSYLHVTMEVDDFSTARRYPQIIVSDAAPPVQWRLPGSNTIILQTFPDEGTANWPFVHQLQICDHRAWEVNDQCPSAGLYRLMENDTVVGLAPIPEVAEHTGVDRSTRLDAFLSTKRAYLFVDDLPYGCLDLPAKGVPSGQVTVTFGDVIYHSGVDEVFAFHRAHQQVVARRHFDNLGFKSGVTAPTWDDGRFPCFPPSAIK